MINSAIIDVGIGLVLVYILLSIVVTQVNNVIVNFLNLRAEHLRDGLERLITDERLRYEVLTHPMLNVVQGEMMLGQKPTLRKRLGNAFRTAVEAIFAPHLTKRNDTTNTSYIEPTVFADVMIDMLIKNPELLSQLRNVQVPQFIELLKQHIDDVNLERTLEALLSTANTIDEAKAKLVTWFNGGMSQLSDLFKRRVQYVSFIVGLLLAVTLNVDTVYMAQTFWTDPSTRQIAVSAANTVLNDEQQILTQTATAANEDKLSQSITRVQQSINDLFDLQLPIGWYNVDPATSPTDLLILSDPRTDGRNFWNIIPTNHTNGLLGWLSFIFVKTMGWLLTAMAVMQGSDFWFNLLRQLTGRSQQPRGAG
ncbi:MAG: hypothetical protein HXY40_02100 [Chloroflexi bacterium]|nr:hypothetical protein [Chloroflexota bacterium]